MENAVSYKDSVVSPIYLNLLGFAMTLQAKGQ